MTLTATQTDNLRLTLRDSLRLIREDQNLIDGATKIYDYLLANANHMADADKHGEALRQLKLAVRAGHENDAAAACAYIIDAVITLSL
jgi:hypothetical protein